ncbi:DUF4142 domain-containing protein [uncultured Sphingomonas sp.]|uniref:DUF4142 domain-containing protein n=1 Tax=Sphingomonas sp. TaxID=28214 RepID=UPI00262D5304|nr:DUF4142 domain-containing protein [uncultured Sphingomonas sp.]
MTMLRMMTVAALVAAAPTAVFAQTVTPAQFVAKAGASDLYEKESSQLVLRSTNPKIRTFAQAMIRDHSKSTADVKAAAAKAGVRPAPPKLEPMQADMVAKLRQASGTQRDQLYVQQQKTAHQQALALHQGYAQSGTAAPLKAAAAKIAPVVQHHLEMLNGM